MSRVNFNHETEIEFQLKSQFPRVSVIILQFNVQVDEGRGDIQIFCNLFNLSIFHTLRRVKNYIRNNSRRNKKFSVCPLIVLALLCEMEWVFCTRNVLMDLLLHLQVINYDSSRGGVSVITEKGDVTTSFLLIQNADLADSGKYSCAPSNADVASVRVHVLNGKYPFPLSP